MTMTAEEDTRAGQGVSDSYPEPEHIIEVYGKDKKGEILLDTTLVGDGKSVSSMGWDYNPNKVDRLKKHLSELQVLPGAERTTEQALRDELTRIRGLRFIVKPGVTLRVELDGKLYDIWK